MTMRMYSCSSILRTEKLADKRIHTETMKNGQIRIESFPKSSQAASGPVPNCARWLAITPVKR